MTSEALDIPALATANRAGSGGYRVIAYREHRRRADDSESKHAHEANIDRRQFAQ